jgi:hypothetical protein
MLDGFDPTTIQDELLRTTVQSLMTWAEDLATKLDHALAEIQRLRDENNQLRGEQGQPTILPKHIRKNFASERERAVVRQRTPRTTPGPQIDRTEVVAVNRAHLPADAQFKGYQRVIVRDLRLTTDTICFRKEKWYSPTTHQTYLAPNPPGYEGQFGPQVKALTFTLAFESGMSEPKIHGLFRLAGLAISRGQISALIHAIGARFATERQAILAAGLRSSPWQHIDATNTRVAGTNQHCHILTNPLYTVYTTLPQKDRLHVLDVLRGGAPRQFWLDQTAERLMRLMDVPQHAQKTVKQTLPRQHLLSEAAIDTFLATAPRMSGKYTKKWIKDALAIAAYHAQRDPPLPVIPLLIGDYAPQWAMLTEELALCWVHDGRAYKRLEPRLDHHRRLRDQILTAYWALYHELRVYQQQPTPAEASRLRAAFDALVNQQTGYAALDARLAITAEKRRGLLMVLEHPEIPLHNNPAELGARRRVRKRDVSFGARTVGGARLWDIGHTLAATAQQLDVNIHHYVVGRLCDDPQIVPLAIRIAERAAGLALGRSWDERPARPAWKPVEVAMWHA